MTATRKGQVLEALARTGENPNDIVCFYQDHPGRIDWGILLPIIKCSVDELPERVFDDGFGGTEGEPFIGFGPKFIYVCTAYDGSEEVVAVPRHPDDLQSIPWL